MWVWCGVDVLGHHHHHRHHQAASDVCITCKALCRCVRVHACMCALLTVFVPADPNLPVPAGYGLTKGEGEGSPLTLVVPSGQSHPPGAGDPPGLGEGGPNDPLNPANIPLPGEVQALPPGSPSQEGTPPHGAKLLSIPLPGEATPGLEGGGGAAAALGVEGTETPGAITIHLPLRWRLARDNTDHVYFYHVKTRVTQWEPPALLNSGLGSDSSSDSSSDSDSDSSSTSDVSHPITWTW